MVKKRSTNERYYDHGWVLFYWASEVEVLCPQCQHQGVVRGCPIHRDGRYQGHFDCQHCHHQMDVRTDHWQSEWFGYGRQPCQKCGFQWVSVARQYPDRKMETGQVSCSNCQAINEIKLSYRPASPSHHDVDPYFGLSLALCEPTRSGSIWAYNAHHLSHLEQYIRATLREGTTVSGSYFSRLPAWVKSAKNRAMVLKAIERLKPRMLTTVDEFTSPFD